MSQTWGLGLEKVKGTTSWGVESKLGVEVRYTLCLGFTTFLLECVFQLHFSLLRLGPPNIALVAGSVEHNSPLGDLNLFIG